MSKKKALNMYGGSRGAIERDVSRRNARRATENMKLRMNDLRSVAPTDKVRNEVGNIVDLDEGK